MTHGDAGRRGKTSMKLLRTLRGDGAVLWSAGEAEVSYQLDLYESRHQRSGSGALDGDLAALAEAGVDAARLRLEDGSELDVVLGQVDPDGATFDTRGALPED